MDSLPRSTETIQRLTREFTGREWVFAEIDRWLEDPEAGRFFILTGEPGVGKSALAARVVQTRSATAYHFCIARSADTTDPLNFARSLAGQLARIEGFARVLLKEKFEAITLQQEIQQNYGQLIGINIGNLEIQTTSAAVAFSQAVVEPLKGLYAGGYDRPLLIVVDGLDEAAQQTSQETIVDLLANAGGLPEQVRWLLTTRPEKNILRQFQHLQIPPWLLDASGKENQADARRFIEEKLAAVHGLDVWLEEREMDRAALVDRLAQASQGNFLYLSWLLPSITQNLDSLDEGQGLPPGLDGIYREFLMTREPGKDPKAWEIRYRPVAGLLAAAQAPLTLEQLLRYSGLGKQALRDVLHDLGQFLDPTGGDLGQYLLYHQSLTDFFADEDRSDDFWIDLTAVHQVLAQEILEHASPDWAACDLYEFKYLPTHLAKGGLAARLRELLEDTLWLEAKLRATDILDLLSDFDLLPGDEELARLHAALRLSIEALVRDKEQLWEQLYGRTLMVQPPLSAVAHPPARPWLRPLTPALEQVGGALVRTLAGHSGPVHCVAMASGGVQAVSGSADHTLKVWDLDTGKVLHTLEGHQESVDLVAVADGRRVISASWEEKKVRVWELDTGRLLYTINAPGRGVGALAVSKDGRLATADRYSDRVSIWNLDTGKRVKLLKLNQKISVVTSLLFIPGRNWLAAGTGIGNRMQVGVWDLERGEEQFQIENPEFEMEITSLAATPDGHWMAFSAGLGLFSGNTWILLNSSIIRIFDLDNRANEITLSGHPGATTALAFSADGKTLVSAGKSTIRPPLDNTIKIWDLPGGECAATLEGHAGDLNSLALTQDGRRAISASSDHSLKVWDLEAARQPRPRRAHDGRISATAISSDGRLAVTAGFDGAIKGWDLGNLAHLFTLKGELFIDALAISDDGSRAVSCGNEYAYFDGGSQFSTNLQVWELREGARPATLVQRREDLRTDWFTAAAVLPGGRQALVAKRFDEHAGDPDEFQLWDLIEGKCVQKWESGEEYVNSLLVFPDGRRFLSVSGVLKMWSLEAGRQAARKLSDRPAVCAALHPDGTWLASGDGNGKIILWETETWTPQVEFQAHALQINGLAWALGGRGLVSASRDCFLAVWDMETAEKNRTPTKSAVHPDGAHKLASFVGESSLTCLAAAPDGITIVVGEESGRLHFLRLELPF
jgi:WD40 repeat protein